MSDAATVPAGLLCVKESQTHEAWWERMQTAKQHTNGILVRLNIVFFSKLTKTGCFS